MKTILKFTLVACLLCGFVNAAVAQDATSFIELMRKDIRTEKSAIITAAMDFTEEEAAVFWPIYRDYEHEMEKLGDMRLAILRDYANNYETMTDQVAKDLVTRAFKVQEQRLKLDKQIWKKVSKELSPIRAARFFQVNGQINDLIDLQIASELPLVDDMGTNQ